MGYGTLFYGHGNPWILGMQITHSGHAALVADFALKAGTSHTNSAYEDDNGAAVPSPCTSLLDFGRA